MRPLRKQLHLPPVEELMQGGEGVLGDGTLVHVAPHLQAHQGHPDVQGPVELRSGGQKKLIHHLSKVIAFKWPHKKSINTGLSK